MARKSTPKVNGQADSPVLAWMGTSEGHDEVVATLMMLSDEGLSVALPVLRGLASQYPAASQKQDSKAKPSGKRTSTRKPKADAPKDSVFVKGCTFTYVKKDSSESQHRIVRTEGDSVIARALASGQERPWKRTTLAAMLQTGHIIVKS